MEKSKKNIIFGSCLPPFGNCADRFVLSGYSPVKRTVPEMIKLAAKVEDLSGIELVGTWHVYDENIQEVRKIIQNAGLKVSMVVPDLWAQAKWGKGGFTSKDEKVRREAMKNVKTSMDWAVELGCDMIDLWFGQDGYDYLFQANYIEAWDQLTEATRECADYRPEVKICIEYKIKEPRTHIFVSTVGKALLLVKEVDRKNVGVLVDAGHALAAGENPAESIALLGRENKLFYVHFNDNYGAWDDDMMVGSVHILQYLEFLYWLKKIGYSYNGWHTLDIFPYREDGAKAVEESIKWIKVLYGLLDRIGYESVEKAIKEGNPIQTSALLRAAICE